MKGEAKYNEAQVLNLLRDSSTSRRGFEIVVRHYSPLLYAQIRKMAIDHDEADDILQNVFLKAWLSLESFRGDSKLSTWLYRITMNECLDFLREQKEHGYVPLEDEAVSQVAGSDPVDGDEINRLFHQAMSTLPEKQRIVFSLKYFKEMKYSEISKVLDTSVGALKASYHLAVHKIAAFLEEHD